MNDRDYISPNISPNTQVYRLPHPFHLESGEILPEVQVAYRAWGHLNAAGNNAILICHALTGSADADDWWEPLFGFGKTFDPGSDLILCSNVLGSCYGTTGPTSHNPATGQPYGPMFPQFTVRDMVHLQAVWLRALGVKHLKLVIGGSLGGMQVLEWAVLYPDMVEAIAVIAASGRHSAWCIGLSEAQRQAIYTDPQWQNGYYSQPPQQGLATARMIAMSTYRSWHSFEERFGRQQQEANRSFEMVNYLRYQGQKLVERFDANTYVRLTQAMDSHDLGRDRGEYVDIVQSILQPTLVVAIDSDILYPPQEQQELAELIPNARFAWLRSFQGHDAFLIDMDPLNEIVVNFCRDLNPKSTNAQPILFG